MSRDGTHDVEVIVACHSRDRPIGRAVASVLEGNPGTRVTVVCHNTDVADIRSAVAAPSHHAVTFLELSDGVRSPSGPFMFGMRHSRATWVMFMGSDDVLQPGHIRAMLRLSDGMDAVMARIVRAGQTVTTPRSRWWKQRSLHAVRDRLYYRSAPLGLLRREFIERAGLELTPGLTAGGDLNFSQQLWRRGTIAVQKSGPGYEIREDAGDRVTMRFATAADELQHCHHVWDRNPPTSPADRNALGIKYLRNHLIGFASLRAQHQAWQEEDQAVLASWVRRMLHEAPLAARVLSRTDVALVRLLADPDADLAEIARAAQRRATAKPWQQLFPADPRLLLHREAPLRMFVAAVSATIWGKR